MATYTISEINQIVNGKFALENNGDFVINHLLIDSRKITNAETSLFFAIKGERHDGHEFISELYEKGIRNFILEKTPGDLANYQDCNFIEIPNSLKALQTLGAYHRKKFELPVIGITGSNGKTIIKEWLYQLLREEKNIVRSPKSFNSQVGVPLSVWQINQEHTLGIFEAGISKPSEMLQLESIIQPSIGVFSNIGEAHNENFKSLTQKVQEKLKLFSNCDILIYCKDYLTIEEEINNISNLKLFSWSRKKRADLQISKISKGSHDTEIQGIYQNDFIRIKIPFTDEASLENAIHCWAIMLQFGYENEKISERMILLTPVAMRLELKEGINNCSIINDSYNSDLGSLAIALDFLNQQKHHPKKTLILSDILQSGKGEEELYKEVADMLEKKGINRLIGIGRAISRQSQHFSIDKVFFDSTKDFLTAYNSSFFQNEMILLKGARAFGFEEISKVIQQKSHETVLEIDLNAIVHNLNYYRSIINPGTKIMAMVKAFSYGSGSFEIANVLQFHRVDYLAVAYADEGIELRRAGITMPIMVMNPEEQSYEAMLHYKLEPEIFSFRVLSMFDQAVRRYYNLGQPVAVHLKLDTGMHRLGFEEKDINELIVRIKNNKDIYVKSVFSHLAASDEAMHDEYTRLQITRFTSMSSEICSHFNYPILRHLLNSSGVSRFEFAQFDMVRIGIGLYGIGASDKEQLKLQHVNTLRTTISQIKHIRANETIGYSRRWIAKKDMQIATLPIGYADGLSRNLSNGRGKILVNGQFAPIVGNICMDMCMIDVTDLATKEGDTVIVFGENYSIKEIAREIGTIPYEVLTNVSRRVKRVYYQE